MTGNDNDPTPVDALNALRARGVNSAEELLAHATPAQILAACHRWDGEQGVGAGLLVRWIRDGQFDEPAAAPTKSKGAQLRERFDEYARRFPPGAIVETHADMLARRWPDDLARAAELGQDICAGQIVVVNTSYPVLELECDACGFSAGLPVRALHVLPAEHTLLADTPDAF